MNDMPINKTNIDLVMLLEQLIEEFLSNVRRKKYLKLDINKPEVFNVYCRW
ncbi:MAG: hypothetical protein L6V91_04845 [Bacilli bacterium]|nr:MAG: hypothetical protein L6V91_04845 [Bacilli bacterium]